MTRRLPIRAVAAAALVSGMSVAAAVGAARADDTPSARDVQITEFSLPTSGALPGGIIVAPDSALWFYETGANKIGRVSTEGQITEFPIATDNVSQPNQGFLGVGPDGAIWFTENRSFSLGRITTDGQVLETPIDFLVRNHVPNAAPNPLLGIVSGPDARLWFTGAISNSIWRMGPGDQRAEFVLPTPRATDSRGVRGIVSTDRSGLGVCTGLDLRLRRPTLCTWPRDR